MSEQEIVNSIIDYINLLGGKAIRINAGLFVMHDNGEKRVVHGAPAGTSDILACYKGRYIAIECKMPGKKLTQKQYNFLREVRDAGGEGYMATSIDDIKDYIK